MPAESETQRKAAGAALRAKMGQLSPRRLRGAARRMFDRMSVDQLRDFARKK